MVKIVWKRHEQAFKYHIQLYNFYFQISFDLNSFFLLLKTSASNISPNLHYAWTTSNGCNFRNLCNVQGFIK